MPIDSNGGGTGSPQIISGTQLAGASGFTDIYFYTDKADGAMTFMDPTSGAVTSGSQHPRSEFHELTSGWTAAGTNTQTVSLAVVQVPDTVTIGQIFQAPPAPSKPVLELQYHSGGSVTFFVEQSTGGGSAGPSQTAGNVTDGSKFTYELSLTGTTISVSVNGKATSVGLPSAFAGESFFFKVGDYDQTAVNGTPGTQPGTVVKVYALQVVHQ